MTSLKNFNNTNINYLYSFFIKIIGKYLVEFEQNMQQDI
jgi:hypothetical protein